MVKGSVAKLGQKSEISCSALNKLAKIMKIFDNIDCPKGQWVH
jgi:hypothetical protein